jgi:hypothetical protein
MGLMVGAIVLSSLCGSRPNQDVRAWAKERRWSLLMALGGIVTVLPGLIVYSETAYLLPILPLVWALAALIAAWVRSRISTPVGGWRSSAVASLAVFAGAVVVQTAARPFDIAEPHLPIRKTVEMLRLTCREKTRLLGVDSSTYADYLGAGWVGIEPFASVGGPQVGSAYGNIGKLIEQAQPDAILVNSQWEGLSSFDRAGIDALLLHGWTRISVPDGILYVRDSAAAPPAP